MQKISKFLKVLNQRQEIRFIEVGIINTIVGYGTYALLVFLGINYLIANTISTIVGVINSYFWNKFYTFQSPKRSASEIVRFVSVYLVSFLIGTLFIYYLVDQFGVNKYVVGVLNLFVTTAISYFGHKYFSFRKKGKI
ncbi:MAG: GtrA family protein [Streptococcaceae bacterium]|jgi:putative flippase GtrA|nr:GtrA family protein [Streptococcaceae bacterium]